MRFNVAPSLGGGGKGREKGAGRARKGAHLGLVTLATLGTRVGPFVRVHPPVAADMRDGLVELPTVPAAEAALMYVCLLVLLEQVGLGEGLATLHTREQPGSCACTSSSLALGEPR